LSKPETASRIQLGDRSGVDEDLDEQKRRCDDDDCDEDDVEFLSTLMYRTSRRLLLH
jgi:hypothetical protein